MENNNNQQAQYQQPAYQQPAYQMQPYQPQVDRTYMDQANEFLIKAIVSGAIASLPVGCIIAAVMASKNRKKILEYLDKGGYHTIRIKTCSAVSRAAKYIGVGFSIFWGIYAAMIAIYFLIMLIFLIFGISSGNI